MQAGLSLCWSQVPHCWKSQVLSQLLCYFLTKNSWVKLVLPNWPLFLIVQINLSKNLQFFEIIFWKGFRKQWFQGSRIEKYLHLQGFLEKSLKIKYALKSTWKSLKCLESPWSLLFSVGLNTVDRDLNQYKIAVPLFGAANAAIYKGTTILYYFSCTYFFIISIITTTILYYFSSTNFSIISVKHFWSRILTLKSGFFPKILVLENYKTDIWRITLESNTLN